MVAPPVDIKRHRYLDVVRDDFFMWLIDLIRAGRVFYLHLVPPCTTSR